jgi:GNAT superfamily N-acetyltransferase
MTPSAPIDAARVRRLALEAARVAATGPGRWHRVVGGVLVTSLGVPTDWSVQAHALGELPSDEHLVQLMDLLRQPRGRRPQVIVTPEGSTAPQWARFGLGATFEMPAFAVGADTARTLAVPVASDVSVRPAADREEFVAAYGRWCGGRHLAEALVTVDDVASGRHEYWVAEVGETVVGTAMIHLGDRSTRLSGIGVTEQFRRRGYGAALTSVAAGEAARRSDPEGRPVDLVWMHASTEGAPLYQRMGFHLVDTHIGLTWTG